MSDSETVRSIFCPSCGKPTRPDVMFCVNCGAQMNAGKQTAGTIFCVSCRQPRTSDGVFCEKCGVRLNGGEQTQAPPSAEASSIKEKLKSFHFRVTAKCPNCGYSGLMGWNKCIPPMSKGLYVLLAVLAAPIALVIFHKKKRYMAHCPNCGRVLTLSKTEVQPIMGSLGMEQYYDADGERVSGGGVLALSFKLAGKWLLIGAAWLIGLFVLLGTVGTLIEKAGWKAPNVPTPSAENAAAPASTSTEPSTPSFRKDDKYVATVRNGVLRAPYNTTTIAKAFEATFTDCKWESKESSKGVQFVEFTGRVTTLFDKYAFDESVHKYEESVRNYKACLAAPPENPIQGWYARREEQEKNASYSGSTIEGGGITCTDRLPDPSRPWFYVVSCRDKDGNDFALANIATLPLLPCETPKPPPDKSDFSTPVKFQFSFSADGQSFVLTYFGGPSLATDLDVVLADIYK